MCAIPERLRGVLTTRRYTNPHLPFTLPYLYLYLTFTLPYLYLTLSYLTCRYQWQYVFAFVGL